ncbi:hypothetical protein F4778DRAFT_773306 [Xylariomycetidae sp. FL2044]|nr:hypothetical protein F4778DRAFT_773306 [Xylariomycetidae sp. FL2044]
MAVGIPLKVKSYFRPKLQKRTRRVSNSSPGCESGENKKRLVDSPPPIEKALPEPVPVIDEQLDCTFLQKLPIEIRKIIYTYVWHGDYDNKYHVPKGRHIHFKDGHWTNTRCVMFRMDEDLELIQKNMDRAHSSGADHQIHLWQRRLSSTWGSRHWRCEERVEYGRPTSVDKTDFGSMMMVCKRMYPEIMESFLENRKFIFNDFYSAHWFFVERPSPFVPYIRDLDLTLSMPFHEYASLILGAPRRCRLAELCDALKTITCLHHLRLSFDIYDRGPWRKVPERVLAARLEGLRALKGFTIELPPSLPIKTLLPFDMQEEEDLGSGGDGSSSGSEKTTTTPFEVVRRPALRYWQFSPGEVERFVWETNEEEKGDQRHCWITLMKDARLISNPYLMDFYERL